MHALKITGKSDRIYLNMARPRLVQELNYSYIESDGHEFDPHSLIFEWGPTCIATARGMRKKHADNWRKFHVGGATVSVDGRGKRAAIFVGANSKPTKEALKKCAEMDAIGAAKREGYFYTAAIFVAATTDTELIKDITGLSTPTLHLCDPCRGLISESTVVVTVGAEEDIFEAHTGKEMWELYADPTIEQHEAIVDPGFTRFAGSRALYGSSVAPLLQAPESATRMMRAEAAVRALRQEA